jgi:hypothetical protein
MPTRPVSIRPRLARRSRRAAAPALVALLVLACTPTAAAGALGPPAMIARDGRYMAVVAVAGNRNVVTRALPTVVPRTVARQTYVAMAWAQATQASVGRRLVLTVREYHNGVEVGHRSSMIRLTLHGYRQIRLRYRARRTGDRVDLYLRRGDRRRLRNSVRLGPLVITVSRAPRSNRGVTPTRTSSTSPQACSAQFGTFSTDSQPGACWRPYGPDSPFNMPIPAAPRVSSQSGGIVQDLLQNGVHFEDGPSAFALVTPGRSPVYWSNPGDPLATIHCTSHWGAGTCNGSDGRSIDGTTIRIPAGAQPEHATDARMTVVDQAAHTEYDFDHAIWSSDQRTLTVYSGGTLPIGTPASTGLSYGTTAAAFGNLAGVVQPSELFAGQINHALSVSLPCTSGYVWPARGPWGFDCGSMSQNTGGGAVAPPLGSLLQLNMSDAEIAATGAPGWEQAVMRAMAHYGLYVNDTNGTGDPHSIETELTDDLSYTSFRHPAAMSETLRRLGASYYAPLDRWILAGLPIRVDRLRVIDPCVQRGTCG